MSKTIELPQMGESVEAGTVLTVLVAEGDRVEAEQGLIEVETDKATTEIPSPEAGVVGEVHVNEGDEVEAGQVIVTLTAEDGESDRTDGPEAEAANDAASRTERDEAKDEEPDDHEPDEHEPDDRETPERPASTAPSAPRPGGTASPTVRRLARELGVDVDDIAASTGSGHVSEGDVKAHVRELLQRTRDAGIDDGLALPSFEEFGEVERQPMGVVRRKTAEVVGQSWRQIPHVTQFDHADITTVRSFRDRFGDAVENAGGRLTLTAILIKVAAQALSHFPRFNASVDAERAELVLKRYVHVGVAVDTKDGLIVPVIRDADRKSLTEVAAELSQLAERARSGDIAPDDLQGASFTVTNLGSLGAAEFTPIVPWPQVAILAVCRARLVPAIDDGELIERRILPLGVSYDHRCIDGADAARFLRWIAEVLEEPMRMTMEPAGRVSSG